MAPNTHQPPRKVGDTKSSVSVSSWSLHRSLTRGDFTLLELPARIAAMGIHCLETCHFHLLSRDADYINQFRAAAAQSHVRLFQLLVDFGDVTDLANGQADLAAIDDWLATAGAIGFERARVIAGKQPYGVAAMARSLRGFDRLRRAAKAAGIRLVVENWFPLLSTPAAVHEFLGATGGEVGLCLDFGNWSGPTKYADLAAIAPYAESCHAKCQFNAGVPDREDFVKCLDITRRAGFSGPYTLIFDSDSPDEVAGLAAEREIVLPYLQTA